MRSNICALKQRAAAYWCVSLSQNIALRALCTLDLAKRKLHRRWHPLHALHRRSLLSARALCSTAGLSLGTEIRCARLGSRFPDERIRSIFCLATQEG
eukprot:1153582-Pyramimonas_sp.AAC.1